MLRNEKEAVIAEVTQLLAGSGDAVRQRLPRAHGGAAARAARQAARARRDLQGRQEHARRHRRRTRRSRAASSRCSAAPPAVTFCGDDLVGAAKALADFARTHPQARRARRRARASLIDAAGVKALASLPPRDVLIAQVRRHHGSAHDRPGHRAAGHHQRLRACPQSGGRSSAPPPARPEPPRRQHCPEGVQAPREVN